MVEYALDDHVVTLKLQKVAAIVVMRCRMDFSLVIRVFAGFPFCVSLRKRYSFVHKGMENT